MKNNTKVSNAIIRRLPRYRRFLSELKNQGVKKISSNELSALIGFTASQIRQDLNTFGGFGQQGYGYSVDHLYEELNKILGLDEEQKSVIVGVGNLGHAIANYTYLNRTGFRTVGMFEVNPNIIGTVIDEVEVQDYSNLEEFVKDNGIDIGVICVTKENAQDVADTLIRGGVKGIWNFAPIDLEIPESVAIENVHLSDSLHALSFMIKNTDDE
jgi:redox-sensing transcriptional repressor